MIVRKATLLEQLLGGLHSGADLYPQDQIVPAGVSSSQEDQVNAAEMQSSQQIAAAVALRSLGKKVTTVQSGALIAAVKPGFPAAKSLQQTDVIVAVNGRPVHTPSDVERVMAGRPVGTTFRFTIMRNHRSEVVPLATVAPRRRLEARSRRRDPGRRTSRSACRSASSIDAGGVGGPSAGLAFALDVVQELGKNVDHGHKVAATGEISLDGRVGEIGGIKQKTIGAREAGVDVFLVPAAECGRCPQVRTWSADHPCEELSTGVARSGNFAATGLKGLLTGSVERAGKCAFSLRANP